MSDSGHCDLRGESDEGLFRLMAGDKRQTPLGKAAFGEFYRRYELGLQRHVLKIYGTYVGRSQGALEDFVEQVFVRFWQYGLVRFDPSLAKVPEDVPKLARKWLANAAVYVAGDWNEKVLVPLATVVGLELEDQHQRQTPHSELMAELEDNARVTRRQQRRTAFFATLESLGSRDHHLLLDFYRYHDEASGACLVDDEVKLKICEQYGFKNWAAARKAKQRAEERLRQVVQAQTKVA